MEPIPHRCGNCGAEIQREIDTGLAQCISCDAPIPGSSFDLEALLEQRRWRKTFWLLFFATPCLSLLIGLIPNLLEGSSILAIELSPLGANSLLAGIIAAPILGSLACGYCLMKQRGQARTTLESFVLPIAYGIGILIIYVSILFMGCLMLVAVTTRK